ncbi:MAG TPA: hypothetical protein VF099_17300, partial [Ktedonobacterales bacterium]
GSRQGLAAASQHPFCRILMFPEVTTTIPGAKNPQQAAENVGAAARPPLNAETMQQVQSVYDHSIRAQVHSRW